MSITLGELSLRWLRWYGLVRGIHSNQRRITRSSHYALRSRNPNQHKPNRCRCKKQWTLMSNLVKTIRYKESEIHFSYSACYSLLPRKHIYEVHHVQLKVICVSLFMAADHWPASTENMDEAGRPFGLSTLYKIDFIMQNEDCDSHTVVQYLRTPNHVSHIKLTFKTEQFSGWMHWRYENFAPALFLPSSRRWRWMRKNLSV